MEKLHKGFVDKNQGNVDKIGFRWLNAAILLKNKDKNYENFNSSNYTFFIPKHNECSGKRNYQ